MQRFEYNLQKKKSYPYFKIMKKDACEFSFLVLDHSRNDILLSFFEHLSPFFQQSLSFAMMKRAGYNAKV